MSLDVVDAKAAGEVLALSADVSRRKGLGLRDAIAAKTGACDVEYQVAGERKRRNLIIEGWERSGSGGQMCFFRLRREDAREI